MSQLILTENELRRMLFESFSDNIKNNNFTQKSKYIKFNHKRKLFEQDAPSTIDSTIDVDVEGDNQNINDQELSNFLKTNVNIISYQKDNELKQKLEYITSKIKNTYDSGNDEIEKQKLLAAVTDQYKRDNTFSWDPDASFLDVLVKDKYTNQQLGFTDGSQSSSETLKGEKSGFTQTQNYLDVASIAVSLSPYLGTLTRAKAGTGWLMLIDSIMAAVSFINRWQRLTAIQEANQGGKAYTVGNTAGGSDVMQYVKKGTFDDVIFWERIFLGLELLSVVPILGSMITCIVQFLKKANLFGTIGAAIVAKSNQKVIRYTSGGVSKVVNFAEAGGTNARKKVGETMKHWNETAGNALTDVLITAAESQAKMDIFLGIDLGNDSLTLAKGNNLSVLAKKIIPDFSNAAEDQADEIYKFLIKVNEADFDITNVKNGVVDIGNIKDSDDIKKAIRSNKTDFDQCMKDINSMLIKNFEKIKPNPQDFEVIQKLYKNNDEYLYDKALKDTADRIKTYGPKNNIDFKTLANLANKAGVSLKDQKQLIEILKDGKIYEFLLRKNSSLYLNRLRSLKNLGSSSSKLNAAAIAGSIGGFSEALENSNNATAKATFTAQKTKITGVITKLLNGEIKNVTDDQIKQLVFILQRSISHNFSLIDFIVNPGNFKASDILKKLEQTSSDINDVANNLTNKGWNQFTQNDKLLKTISDFNSNSWVDNLIIEIPRIVEDGLNTKSIAELSSTLSITTKQFTPLINVTNNAVQNLQEINNFLVELIKQANNVATTDIAGTNAKNVLLSLHEIIKDSLIQIANSGAAPYGLNILQPIVAKTTAGGTDLQTGVKVAENIGDKIAKFCSPDYMKAATELNILQSLLNFVSRLRTLFGDKSFAAFLHELPEALKDAVQALINHITPPVLITLFSEKKAVDVLKKDVSKIRSILPLFDKVLGEKKFGSAGFIKSFIASLCLIPDLIILPLTTLMKDPPLFIMFTKAVTYMSAISSLASINLFATIGIAAIASLKVIFSGVIFKFIMFLVTNRSATLSNIGVTLLENINNLIGKSLKQYIKLDEKVYEYQRKVKEIEKLKQIENHNPTEFLRHLLNKNESDIEKFILNNDFESIKGKTEKEIQEKTIDNNLRKYVLKNQSKFATEIQDKFDSFLTIIKGLKKTTKTNIRQTRVGDKLEDITPDEFNRQLNELELDDLTDHAMSALKTKYQEFKNKFEEKALDEKTYSIFFFFYLRQKMLNLGITNNVRVDFLHAFNVIRKTDQLQQLINTWGKDLNNNQENLNIEGKIKPFITDYLRLNADSILDGVIIIKFFHDLLKYKNILTDFKKNFSNAKGLLNLDAMLTGGLYNVKFIDSDEKIELDNMENFRYYGAQQVKANFNIKNNDGTTTSKKATVSVPYLRLQASYGDQSRLIEDVTSLSLKNEESLSFVKIDLNIFKDIVKGLDMYFGITTRLANQTMRLSQGGEFDMDYIMSGKLSDTVDILQIEEKDKVEGIQESVRKIIRKKLINEMLLKEDLFSATGEEFSDPAREQEVRKDFLKKQQKKNDMMFQLQDYSKTAKSMLNVESNNTELLQKEYLDIADAKNKKFEEKFGESLKSDTTIQDIAAEFKDFRNYSVATLIKNPKIMDDMVSKLKSRIDETRKLAANKENQSLIKQFFGFNEAKALFQVANNFEQQLLPQMETLKKTLDEYRIASQSPDIKSNSKMAKLLNEIEKNGLYNPKRGAVDLNDQIFKDKYEILKPGSKYADQFTLNDKFNLLDDTSSKLLYLLKTDSNSADESVKDTLIKKRNVAMIDFMSMALNNVLALINNDAIDILEQLSTEKKDVSEGVTGKSVIEYYKILFNKMSSATSDDSELKIDKEKLIEYYKNFLHSVLPEEKFTSKTLLSPDDKIVGFICDNRLITRKIRNLNNDLGDREQYGEFSDKFIQAANERYIPPFDEDQKIITKFIMLTKYNIEEIANQQQNENISSLAYLYELDISDLYVNQFKLATEYSGKIELNKQSFFRNKFENKNIKIINPITGTPDKFTFSYFSFDINPTQPQKIYTERDGRIILFTKTLQDAIKKFMPDLLKKNIKN